jgi:methionyl-tRNA formyltransferase
MKLIFAGTPEFAAVALAALQRAGHAIALVLTQPDRPAGRGLRSAASPVKRLATELELPIAQPPSLRVPGLATELAGVGADAMVVAAYGLIIPRDILGVPRLGCINIHASLLPRWRGAAPIQRALLAGDPQTGISIMQMDAGLDTGPVLLRAALPITSEDTAQTLHDRLATLGAELIVRALDGPHVPEAQDEALATYAAKIEKREAQIDWTTPAEAIERKVRAFNPVPGAATVHGQTALKIWRTVLVPGVGAAPGTIDKLDSSGITVACGSGSALRVLELQRAGGKWLPVSAFLAGHALKPGERLGPP